VEAEVEAEVVRGKEDAAAAHAACRKGHLPTMGRCCHQSLLKVERNPCRHHQHSATGG